MKTIQLNKETSKCFSEEIHITYCEIEVPPVEVACWKQPRRVSSRHESHISRILHLCSKFFLLMSRPLTLDFKIADKIRFYSYLFICYFAYLMQFKILRNKPLNVFFHFSIASCLSFLNYYQLFSSVALYVVGFP